MTQQDSLQDYLSATTLINLDRYPINQPGPARDALIAEVRASLADDGCAVLKQFLTPEGVAHITREADQVADKAHRSFGRTNPYFTDDDDSLPVDDPRRRFFDRSNAFIPADNFLTTGALRCVHDFPAFDPFIKDCLEEEKFYRYADPLADVIINMAEEGNGFPWHFDTNNFTVTLAIQNADGGGDFEYAPNIRRDGEAFDEVRDVLDGRSDKVRSLTLEPGDLQLFKGRYSLHRVAPLYGTTPRYVAIFSYGRVLPIHIERANMRNDSFID